MKPFNVYPLLDIEPVKAEGSYLWDKNGTKYLDLYGGHAVISIGHSHPHYVKMITDQLERIGFYSNSVKMGMQEELAFKLGELSGYPDYAVFFCNSGAEANENAFKLASFRNGRKKIIAFRGSFHGRTSLAVASTDDRNLIAPVNANENIIFLPFNDETDLEKHITSEVSAVIVEGIQGVGGIHVASARFLEKLKACCVKTGTILILDEVQSGCGRSGKFFAHQYAGIKPDLITIAKGMGNGFPIGAVLISPEFKAKHGMLGTTFGGAHLACAAGIAVLDVIEQEKLMENARASGDHLMTELKQIDGVREVRGLGLMIGIELEILCSPIREQLLNGSKIFTGSSANKNTIRILPALTINKTELDIFLDAFKEIMSKQLVKND